jgi:hypothetical protein
MSAARTLLHIIIASTGFWLLGLVLKSSQDAIDITLIIGLVLTIIWILYTSLSPKPIKK